MKRGRKNGGQGEGREEKKSRLDLILSGMEVLAITK